MRYLRIAYGSERLCTIVIGGAEPSELPKNIKRSLLRSDDDFLTEFFEKKKQRGSAPAVTIFSAKRNWKLLGKLVRWCIEGGCGSDYRVVDVRRTASGRRQLPIVY